MCTAVGGLFCAFGADAEGRDPSDGYYGGPDWSGTSESDDGGSPTSSTLGDTSSLKSTPTCPQWPAYYLGELDRLRTREILDIFSPNRPIHFGDILAIREYLANIQARADITQVVDRQGLNLVQWLVIKNCHTALDDLLNSPRCKVNLTGYRCNAPLHLAAKLGHKECARVLLSHGASAQQRASVCYGELARHRKIWARRVTPRTRGAKRCTVCSDGSSATPLEITLKYDRHEVLRELLYAKHRSKVPTKSILYHACAQGAVQCLQVLIQDHPFQVNERIPYSGETALGVALKASEECARVLLEGKTFICQDDILMDCTGKSDTVLHVLYASANCIRVYDMTKLIVRHGNVAALARNTDREGNAAMHVLCRHTGRRLRDAHKQALRDDQVERTIHYLLERGVRLDIGNLKGETPLHLLFEDNSSRRLLPRPHSPHAGALEQVARILQVLLDHEPHININHRNANLAPVLNRVVRLLCSLEAPDVRASGYLLVRVLRTLIDYGGNRSLPDEKGFHSLNRLLTAANRWLSLATLQPDTLTPSLDVSRDVVSVLLEDAKLPVNALQLAVKQITILSNISLPTGTPALAQLRTLMRDVLNGGLDPNFLGQPECRPDYCEVADSNSAAYYMARAFVINGCHKDLIAFLKLLQNSMTQKNASRFTGMVNRIIKKDFSNLSPATNDRRPISKEIEDTLTVVPLLSSVCRTVINEALHWNLREKVPQLPLPGQLRDFLYAK